MKKTDNKSGKNGEVKPSISAKSKAKSDATAGLRTLFVNELKDIYWAEKALTKAIPKMIKTATSEELAAALTEHLATTKLQIVRLEDVFQSIGEKATAIKCEAMAGLTKEAEEIMESTGKGRVCDAGIISAAQKVEHYEIATYGTLCAFADILGETKAASLLNQTLQEEKDADENLTQISHTINAEAIEEYSEGESMVNSNDKKSKRK